MSGCRHPITGSPRSDCSIPPVTVGKVQADGTRASENLLIRGDALHGLTSLLELPEFARQYAAKVRLVYVDPPFNTQQSFLQYDDALEHSVWIRAHEPLFSTSHLPIAGRTRSRDGRRGWDAMPTGVLPLAGSRGRERRRQLMRMEGS